MAIDTSKVKWDEPASSTIDASKVQWDEPKQQEVGFGDAFTRGFKRTLPETKGLLYGAGAAIAGAVGADGLRDAGLENYQRIQREEVAPLQSGATFKRVLSGEDSAGEWAGDVLGNFAGQALQSVATGVAGAAVGSAAPGAGTVVGGVGGLVARGAAKKAIESQARKMIAEQVAKGATREVAEAAAGAATQRTLRKLGGAALATGALNVGQETGISYTGRAEDAAATGEQLDQGDALRAIGAGAVAGSLDTAAEAIGAGRILRGASASPSRVRRVLAGAATGATVEGATEGAQAVVERFGAQRDVASPEAIDEYIENAAAGALGGGVMGAPSGIRRRLPSGAELPDPSAGPLSRTVNQAADMGALAEQQPVVPVTPDGAQVPPAAAPAARAPQPVPAGQPQAEPAPPAETSSAVVDQQQLPLPPWVNAETGAIERDPTIEEGKAYVHDRLNQLEAEGGAKPNRARWKAELAVSSNLLANSILGAVQQERAQGLTAPAERRADVFARLRTADTVTEQDRVALGANETVDEANAIRLFADLMGQEQSAARAPVAAIPAGADGRRATISVLQAAQASLRSRANQSDDAVAVAPAEVVPQTNPEAPAQATPAADSSTAGQIAPATPSESAAAANAPTPARDEPALTEPNRQEGTAPAQQIEPAAEALGEARQAVPEQPGSPMAGRTTEAPLSAAAQSEAGLPPPSAAPVAADRPSSEGAPAAEAMQAAASADVVPKRAPLNVRMGGQEYPVASIEDASAKFLELRNRVGDLGGMRAVELIDEGGARVGYIGHNGEVYEGPLGTSADRAAPVYDPKTPRRYGDDVIDGTAAAAAAAPAEAKSLEAAAHEAATSPTNDRPEPTEAQKEAGNYKKGHHRIAGLDVAIENPAGTKRNPKWPALKNHYGYFKGTVGKDKDHVDVFMTDRAEDTALPVFVVDQVNKDGTFDEHKVIMGAASIEEARKTYMQNYSRGWTGLGNITAFTQDEFKAWVRDTAKTKKPAAPARAQAAAAQQGATTTTPKTRIVAGRRVYVPAARETLEAYFQPGREIAGYGGKDRVLAFEWNDGDWRVHVQGLTFNGKDVSGDQPRWHRTLPERRELLDVLGDPAQYGKQPKARAAAPVADRKPAEGHAAPPATPAPKAVSTEDAGEELWANRRNSTGKGLTWSEIEGLNETLKAREAVKSKVWPRPNYEELIEGGMPRPIAHIIKQVYDAIAVKPQTRTTPTDEQYQDYISALQRIRDASFDWARKVMAQENVGGLEERVRAAASTFQAGVVFENFLSLGQRGATPILDAVFPLPAGAATHGRFRHGDQGKANNALAHMLGGNRVVRALQPSSKEASNAASAIADGWPAAQEAWAKSYQVHEKQNGEASTYYVTKKGRRSPVSEGHATHQAAVDAARTLASAKRGGDGAKAEVPVDLQDDARQGPARRAAGEDVTSEQLKETFGFRGVNFGNWMKGERAKNVAERQAHLNHAYDSFMDLAEILGVPPKALSLNGALGVAFGAQGAGGRQAAAAHFVPGVDEINLTRDAGAGALAHEWGHAFDHYFARMAGGQVATGKEPFLTEHVIGGKDFGKVRPEVVQAFRTIVQTMRSRPETEAEYDTRVDMLRRGERDRLIGELRVLRQELEHRAKPEAKVRALEEFDQLADRLRRGDIGEGYVSTGRGRRDAAPQVVGLAANLYKDATGRKWDRIESIGYFARSVAAAVKAEQGTAQHIPQQISMRTDYLSEALKLEGERKKPYWSTSLEMFARAFQSYVLDRLATQGSHNHYLTRPQMTPEQRKDMLEGPLAALAEAGDRYPRGAERARINQAFDVLVDQLKTEQGADGRVALFSRRGWDEDFPDAVLGHRMGVVQAHADYAAAKSGDVQAAVRLAQAVVTDAYAAQIREALPKGARPVIVPVLAQEATGNNQIPLAAAHALGQKLGLQVEDGIVQATKVGRGGADGLSRLGRQPRFSGAVEAGQTYLLLDDTLTQGGTFAQLKTHIEDKGGRVVLASALTGKDYSRKISLSRETLASVRERFGSIEDWWRAAFDFGFEGLTESEARFLLGLRGNPSPDAVRDRIVAGGLQALQRSDEGTLRSQAALAEDLNAPPRAGRSTSGLSFGRAQDLKSELTAHWGPGAPVVRLVESAAELQRAAGLDRRVLDDPSFYRAEGLYNGTRAVWINVGMIRTEKRFAEVLAHEALGHYGVEQVVGAEEWGGIVDSIERMDREGLGGAQMRAIMAEVHKKQPGLDRVSFAKEVIAFMAEKGQRNGLMRRVIAAVRRFLRKIMPSMRWREIDVRHLLAQSDSFLHRGPARAQRARAVQAHAFSKEEGTSVDKEEAVEIELDAAFVAGLSPNERRSPALQGLAAAMYADLGTASPFFRDWFRESKVVDKAGEPVRLYHGTDTAFAAFDPDRYGLNTQSPGAGLGMFTTTDRDMAELYGETVFELYGKATNPYTMSSKEIQALPDVPAARERAIELQAKGFDAIHVPDMDVWVFFRAEQLKRVDNRGMFDRGDNRLLFSKAPAEILDDIQAVMDDTHQETIVARARAALADLVPKKVKDQLRPTWLGALTTRHLTELGRDHFENIRHYSDFLAEMGANRNELQAEGEEVAERARKWAGKNRAQAKALFELMHDSTIDGVDPAEDFAPLQFRYSGKLWEATPKNVKEALKAIREQIRGRSGDNKIDMYEEAKLLRGMPGRDKVRRAKYPDLVDRWNQLSPDAQAIYRDFRDAYKARSEKVEEALVARINDTDAADIQKQRAINIIRRQFETQRLQGVYFPLQRFGRYFAAAEKDGTPTFLMFERLSELEKAVKDLRARGFTITAQGLKGEGKAQDAPSGTFVAQVIQSLQKAGVSDKTQDEIYQLYLQTMPEMSMRKHAIHRQSVPGFDPDAVRAFAFNMHHGAHQLARLRYAHKLQAVLDVLKKQQDLARREAGSDTRKIAAGDAVLQELTRRHEWIMNPTDSQATSLVSSFGFIYYLGLTPAAALVNLTQTALVSYPYLAARYGGVKAMNHLLAGMRDSIRTGGHIQRTLTDPEELQAHAVLQRIGALDKTQAHNLAGIAEGGLSGYNPAWAKAMEIIGWGFHKTEVVNREATGLAAFRLARADGKSFNEAVQVAADTINETHFDYTNQNRARFMQSGTAKVLLMFRQYSLNMTWHLARMVWNATKGQTPEVKKLARRNLAGLLGMSFLFSGALGLPLMSVGLGVLNAVASSFGDDDEPWDAETEFRAFLADMLGPAAAGVLLGGAANPVTGADVGSRVSLSQLWFRDADRELEGRGLYYNLLEQAAGPMGGVLKNAIVGKQLMDDGHLMRGVETVLPKALKDVVKAGRFASEGANTLRGDALLPDLSLRQTLLQLAGFAPAELADRYDRNSALKNYEEHILNRRTRLIDAFAMAQRLGDSEGRRDTLVSIRKFNQANPEIAISGATIRRSLMARSRYSKRAEAGIVLNPKLAAKVRAAVGED